MIIRQIQKEQWERVYRQITEYGRTTPLSLQYDIDVNCNGMDYVLKVQPEPNRRIAVLQAMDVSLNEDGNGVKEFGLITENCMLSSLLEIILYQGVEKRGPLY